MYRGLPRYTSEEQTTHEKLQELPDVIKGVTNELSRLRNDFEDACKLGEMNEKMTDEELRRECLAKGIREPDDGN
jgi:chromosome segregation ATPase